MYPMVWREVKRTCRLSCVEFEHKFDMRFVHSPLGISIAAIAAIRDAIYERTFSIVEFRVDKIASLTLFLNAGSNLTQRSA